MSHLSPAIQEYILEKAELCQPDNIVVCDGSDEGKVVLYNTNPNPLLEQVRLISQLQAEGLVKKIPKMENCWLAKTDPKDVARVESKTVICTDDITETIPTPAEGVEGNNYKWTTVIPDML